MKISWLCITLALLAAAPAAVSGQESLIELLRADVRAEKVALITETMMLTDEQAEVFWPIYRDYEAELGKITDTRIAGIKDYAANYDQMTEAKAKELIDGAFAAMEKRLALQKKYFKKISKALDPVTAARFMQVENEINLLVDLQIASELPFFQ